MTQRLVVGLCLAGLAQGSVAAAETCVGAGFDQPFPGATAVVTRQADVPTPQFPGLWQEGLIGGYFYELYANGEASLKADPAGEAWQITVDCKEGACAQTVQGNPPDGASQIAAQLGQCLVSPVVTPILADPVPAEAPPEAPVEASAEAAPVVAEAPAEVQPTPVPPPEEAKPPCGLATLPAADPGTTLQLLLVAAGADPGPIDGMPGQNTMNALASILGQGAKAMAIDAAISALDAHLCAMPSGAPTK
ncbi:hypothetical protein [Pseudotabrizicola sp. L79]|uniref:hypothetical protein n=1 Tax=Pseudotabrizicola sp. L79 TaxID=3118402 RepID=UPI002F95ADA7